MNTCVICGDLLPADADFCGGCGTPRALAMAPSPAPQSGVGHPVAPPDSGPPTARSQWGQGLAAGPSPSSGSGAARGIVAGLAALLLGGIGAGSYVLLHNRSGDRLAVTTSTAAAGPAATPGSPQTSAAPSDATPDATHTATARSSGTPPARRVITMPDTATACRAFDDSRLSTAYSGNDVTSCPFAEAVRAAYVRALGPKRYSDDVVGTRKIRAYSPVTKKDYIMTCTDTNPVMCRGGNNAVVYIASYQDAG